ncbi:MAG: helix-turn-helix domain-containing protein [Lactobacillales bacterium]|jgi:transcriptional regulator with XRE-family HTH domain|nr:helix-turn-helix domain-containing protein [Lactobacillales bacterium]
MKHSELIRKLRKERGLTQSQLAEGICSRGTISGLEKGISQPSFEIITQLIDRLNLSLSEYDFILREKQFTKKQKDLIYIVNNPEEIDSLLTRYKETNDFYYYWIYIQRMLVLEKKRGKTSFNEYYKERENIEKRLNQIEEWTSFECALFINSLFLFDDDFIFRKYDLNMKEMLDQQYVSQYADIYSAFLLNAVTLFFERDNAMLRDYFLRELNQKSMRPQEIYYKMHVTFFDALISKQYIAAEKIILWFNIMKYENKGDELKRFLEKHKK